MSTDRLAGVRIVLVGTTHPGNIGGAARAMRAMGLRELVLVDPKRFPDPDASARAVGALDVLESARVISTLDEALAGCVLAVGTSARLRGQAAWRVLDPATAAPELLAGAAKGPVAVVFGRESSGLSNEEMDRCHAILHVPVAADFKSLNLASAVQIVAYELFRHSGVAEAIPPARDAAPAEKLEGLFTHLRQVAEDTGFAPGQRADSLVRKLRRMFFRATPTDQEVDILRGLFSACQGRKSARRGGE